VKLFSIGISYSMRIPGDDYQLVFVELLQFQQFMPEEHPTCTTRVTEESTRCQSMHKAWNETHSSSQRCREYHSSCVRTPVKLDLRCIMSA